jgi:hypothetical protein
MKHYKIRGVGEGYLLFQKAIHWKAIGTYTVETLLSTLKSDVALLLFQIALPHAVNAS